MLSHDVSLCKRNPVALRINFHAERELEHPKTTFFHHFSNYSTPTYVVVVLFVVNQRSKLDTYSAEVPVWHTPVQVVEVRFSLRVTCCAYIISVEVVITPACIALMIGASARGSQLNSACTP